MSRTKRAHVARQAQRANRRPAVGGVSRFVPDPDLEHALEACYRSADAGEDAAAVDRDREPLRADRADEVLADPWLGAVDRRHPARAHEAAVSRRAGLLDRVERPDRRYLGALEAEEERDPRRSGGGRRRPHAPKHERQEQSHDRPRCPHRREGTPGRCEMTQPDCLGVDRERRSSGARESCRALRFSRCRGRLR